MEHPQTVLIHCDSRGAIQNSLHPNFSDKLRHVSNKIFFVRSLIKNGHVAAKWIPGTLNPADLGTKCLGAATFRIYSGFLMNLPEAVTHGACGARGKLKAAHSRMKVLVESLKSRISMRTA